MHIVIVLSYDLDKHLAFFRGFATREEAEGAASYWANKTDSEGRSYGYRAFIGEEVAPNPSLLAGYQPTF